MKNDRTISWTQEKLASLEKSYERALKDGVETFTWEGYEFLVGYAKYLIEYLKINFSRKP